MKLCRLMLADESQFYVSNDRHVLVLRRPGEKFSLQQGRQTQRLTWAKQTRFNLSALLVEGYVNKQNCRIWSEANPQVYVETPLHPEKLTVWCALWAGGILLQKR
ncbi:hypothetical protein TNCV_3931931 [Trichonephila clavipes]|nr:hypothetical protein TNCV_3931931 [Trichonephila clavipes]